MSIASFDALDKTAFVDTFYKLIFKRHPSLVSLFKSNHGMQKTKFIKKIGALLKASPDERLRLWSELRMRHISYAVKDEMYPIVVGIFLESLNLHQTMSTDTMDLWSKFLHESM